MSRQFEDAGNKNKRKWQCFVCGRQHDNYEDYKEHIKIEHDEGREYITCPACEAPVREMRSHFKVKHPQRILPKNVQYKVTVWNDFSANGKKKKTRRPTARNGYHESTKMGVPIHYRSGYEEEIYGLLDEDRDVATYYGEPFKIPYFHQGKWHNYTPDIRVNYIDGSTEIWEVKPATQTAYEVNKSKWAAMNTYAENNGWKFNVVTEVGMGKLKHKVNRQHRP